MHLQELRISILIPAAINTVIMAAISLLLAVPFGIGSAIYLVEYAKKGNKLVKVIRVTAETLTGIPKCNTMKINQR